MFVRKSVSILSLRMDLLDTKHACAAVVAWICSICYTDFLRFSIFGLDISFVNGPVRH